MKKLLKKRSRGLAPQASKRSFGGFTIIEVTIVLAIAGLIMLMVFLAVPALQRNSRNTQRRNDATHLASLVNEYAANHAGTLPTAVCTSGVCAATAVDATKENWAYMTPPFATQNTGTFPATSNTSTMVLALTQSCNPATNTVTGGTTRSFAILFNVETSGGGQNACVSE